MKILLIILGYILGAFITLILFLYTDRCEFGPSRAYYDIGLNLVPSLFWPISIWLALGCLLYLKLKKFKKYLIAIVEVLYQINHKEGK